MRLNRVDLKKIMYGFNAASNRLLQADFDDYSVVLSKYLKYLTETELIYEYISDCGECDQDMDQEFKEVRTQRAVFELGDSDEEEVRNVYAILKYIVDNNIDVCYSVGMSYSRSRKSQDIVRDFNSRVTMVLIRHIEKYLTNIGIDMGIDDRMTYNITVRDGQVNIASDNAKISANSIVSGMELEELLKLIEAVRLAAKNSDLSSDDIETINSSLEVIEEEVKTKDPRKRFIKTALTGIKTIKGTAEFSAAVLALSDYISTLI